MVVALSLKAAEYGLQVTCTGTSASEHTTVHDLFRINAATPFRAGINSNSASSRPCRGRILRDSYGIRHRDQLQQLRNGHRWQQCHWVTATGLFHAYESVSQNWLNPDKTKRRTNRQTGPTKETAVVQLHGDLDDRAESITMCVSIRRVTREVEMFNNEATLNAQILELQGWQSSNHTDCITYSQK